MSLSLVMLQEKIDARNLRERGLLFVCALAVVFLLWNLLVQSSFAKQQQVLNKQLQDISSQRQTLDAQVASITLALATDPNLEQKNHIAQIKAEISELDNQLGSLTQGLVSADKLPQILQEVLTKMSRLTLLRVQTLPADELPLIVAGDVDQQATPSIQAIQASPPTTKTTSQGAGVFKHSVVVRVSGSYFELLEFVRLLEVSEWRFYWEQLDYRVTRYPNADILLRVYTLSAEKGYLGV